LVERKLPKLEVAGSTPVVRFTGFNYGPSVLGKPKPDKPQRGLGAAIRRLREEAGLSRRSLAERVGRSPSWLSQIEGGDYDPSWGDMRKVAQALSVSLERLAEVAEELEAP
jgi:DNA-binding XRE family transcriptional regulator